MPHPWCKLLHALTVVLAHPCPLPPLPTPADPSEPGDLLPAGGPGGVDSLLSDPDGSGLFKSMDHVAVDFVGGGGVSDMALDSGDTDGILDFIRDLPDINPVSAAAGGMFKSRSAVNLSSLGTWRWLWCCGTEGGCKGKRAAQERGGGCAGELLAPVIRRHEVLTPPPNCVVLVLVPVRASPRT